MVQTHVASFFYILSALCVLGLLFFDTEEK
jgi:hypothetical protein